MAYAFRSGGCYISISTALYRISFGRSACVRRSRHVLSLVGFIAGSILLQGVMAVRVGSTAVAATV
jgi:hypothetical protein